MHRNPAVYLLWEDEMITEKNRKNYLQNGGVKCPYCQSNNIDAIHISLFHGGARQTVICNACNESWIDIYELTGVEEKS
jgi:transposase-like protein